MIRRTFIWCVLSILGIFSPSPGQQDTVKRELPKLEIPEITIVGKKAITLPFARKGELYDVDIYQAPMPDTTLLGTPPGVSLLTGSLPRYEHQLMPWRFSVEAVAGSFTTLGGHAYADYKAGRWGATGAAGFNRTNGHVANTSSSSLEADASIHSLFATDHSLLKTLKASFGVDFKHESYGMFGVPSPKLRRSKNLVGITGALGTVEREGTTIDLQFGTHFTSLTDTRMGNDSGVSVTSPEFLVAFGAPVHTIRLTSALRYTGSSLEYRSSSQSPSLLNLAIDGEWILNDHMQVTVGGVIANGSDSHGGERSLVMPAASVRWRADALSELRVWFRPELHFISYDDRLKDIPYLSREISLRPEHRPIVLGAAIAFHRDVISFEVRGTIVKSTEKAVPLADSGRIQLAYVEAFETGLAIEGTLSLVERTRVSFTGLLTSARESGASTQLPMVPVVDLNARGEFDLPLPATLWSNLRYLSPRNADLSGTRTLGSTVTLDAGASVGILARTSLSLEVRNLIDTKYELWEGYTAPGIQFNLNVKVNLR